jgi:hypothetical protein
MFAMFITFVPGHSSNDKHDVEGELQDADINLAERIGNDNGNLVFN